MKLVLPSALFLTVLPFATAIAQTTVQCVNLAGTLKEYNISNESTAFLNSVFNQYCERNGQSKSSSAGFGLEAVVKAIPLKISGNYGSTSEAIRNFCGNYSSLADSSSTSNLYQERIASKALDTIDACLRIAAAGASIYHEVPNSKTLNFFMSSGAATKVELQGLYATPSSAVECSGHVANAPQKFDESTHLKIDGTQSVACRRLPIQAADGKSVYEETVVTVSTNIGNYSVFLPHDERLPVVMAQQLSDRVARAEAASGTLDRRLTGLASGSTLDVYQCPSGKTPGANPQGGKWGSYGCQGQVSTQATCQNIEYAWTENRQCSKLGKMRLQ